MNFRPELAAKAVSGSKTVTRRLVSDNPLSPWYRHRCGYQPGKVFTVNPGRGKVNIGRARVVSVRLERLGHLSDEEARREGFEDAAAFEAAFVSINGVYRPLTLVWRIEFQALAREAP